MAMSLAEREQVSLLRRQAHAAGSLAQAVADAASPLAMSQSLQVRRGRVRCARHVVYGVCRPNSSAVR